MIRSLQDAHQRIEVGQIQRIRVEALGTLFDQRIVVGVLLEIQIVLLRIGSFRDELAVDRATDFSQDRLHQREQVFGRSASQFLHTGLVEAERVP